MESARQRKIAGLIQKDTADILQRAAVDGGLKGVIISVTKVNVTVDLSIAKVYLSIFPSDKGDEIIAALKENGKDVRHELAQRTRHQLRRMPELIFYKDDSLDYIEGIENSLKGEDNPISNRDLLEQGKKK